MKRNKKQRASAPNQPANLYLRQGDGIVEAPPEDQAVLMGYEDWVDKGPISNGERLTIMTTKNRYSLGEEVRVIHVLEITEPGRSVYCMGPKPIRGEYVDGQLRTAPPDPGTDPLIPDYYDGRVLPGPAVDHNYVVTLYVFQEPGVHTICWTPSSVTSNVLRIQVDP